MVATPHCAAAALTSISRAAAPAFRKVGSRERMPPLPAESHDAIAGSGSTFTISHFTRSSSAAPIERPV